MHKTAIIIKRGIREADDQVSSQVSFMGTLQSDCGLDGVVVLGDGGKEHGRSLAHRHVKLVVSCTESIQLWLSVHVPSQISSARQQDSARLV
jgi:ATP adenylyltransferase/5',5'''-P-1,P-4-tetraphosphate phosphorylase II